MEAALEPEEVVEMAALLMGTLGTDQLKVQGKGSLMDVIAAINERLVSYRL